MKHTEERLHAMDAVRAFALLLGILFHASASFIAAIAPGGVIHWAVTDNSQSWVLLGLASFSHMFRMTLFFFIAGFFAHLFYHRRGVAEFAKNRWLRIVVPFVIGWCVLTPVNRAIWWWGGAVDTIDLWPSAADWSNQNLRLTHLWFLYYLLLMYVVIVGLRHLCIDWIDPDSRLRARLDGVLLWATERRVAPLIISLPFAFVAFFAPQWNPLTGIPTPDGLIPELISSVGYGLSFATGWLFHRNASLLKALELQTKSSLWPALLTMVLFGGAAGLMTFMGTSIALPRTSVALLGATLTWYINLAIIRFALRRFATPSVRIRYMSDASYWLYIVHVPVVCVLQIWVANWPIHWIIKYPLIVSIALAVLLLSYHYFVRFTFVGAVLNGRRVRRES